MNELNITDGQAVLVLVVLLLWGVWLLYRVSREDKRQVEVTEQAEELNPDYGAYVWLAGKRYN